MPFAPKKILVPVDILAEDGAELGAFMVKEAVDIAKLTGAKLHLLTVLPPIDAVGGPDFSGEILNILEQAREAQHKRADADLEKLREIAKAEGVEVETEVITSPSRVSETLSKAAEERNADLMVMLSHGRKGLKRLFLGSVAERVAHLSHVPVLLLRAPGGDAVAAE